jgi:hypothetical protein
MGRGKPSTKYLFLRAFLFSIILFYSHIPLLIFVHAWFPVFYFEITFGLSFYVNLITPLPGKGSILKFLLLFVILGLDDIHSRLSGRV